MAPGKAPRISRFHVLTTRDNATKVLCPRLVRVPATHVPSSVHRRNACQERWRGFWDSGRGRALTFIFESGVKPGFLEFLSVLLTGNILFKTPALLASPPPPPPTVIPTSQGRDHGWEVQETEGDLELRAHQTYKGLEVSLWGPLAHAQAFEWVW